MPPIRTQAAVGPPAVQGQVARVPLRARLVADGVGAVPALRRRLHARPGAADRQHRRRRQLRPAPDARRRRPQRARRHGRRHGRESSPIGPVLHYFANRTKRLQSIQITLLFDVLIVA